ncbi:MAG: biopolymer transporter ExbD [Lutimonas sp.]|jgi:biopolymer transport protein ExbD
MSKFKKKKKGTPGISTASLPDIVFMLLFFFMVSTVMRETELKVKQSLPFATEVKKLERKSLVSYIYVGKVDGQNGDKIQLNDRLADVNDVKYFVFAERETHPEEEIPLLTTSIKADIESSVGTITDIKEELRNVDALKINYSTRKGDISRNMKK